MGWVSTKVASGFADVMETARTHLRRPTLMGLGLFGALVSIMYEPLVGIWPNLPDRTVIELGVT
jgi:hypothetical protein